MDLTSNTFVITGGTSGIGRRSGATIVNVSSGLAFVPLSLAGLYCASKAALHSLTMSLRSIAQFVTEALAGDQEVMVGSTRHFRANADEMYARMNP